MGRTRQDMRAAAARRAERRIAARPDTSLIPLECLGLFVLGVTLVIVGLVARWLVFPYPMIYLVLGVILTAASVARLFMVHSARRRTRDGIANPGAQRFPVLVRSDQFEQRLKKLQTKAPDLLTDEICGRIKVLHNELAGLAFDEVREESIAEADGGGERLWFKITRLENGKTSLVLRAAAAQVERLAGAEVSHRSAKS